MEKMWDLSFLPREKKSQEELQSLDVAKTYPTKLGRLAMLCLTVSVSGPSSDEIVNHLVVR